MALSQEEFDAIIADKSKRIVGDVAWSESLGHQGAVEFGAPVLNYLNRPLRVHGWFRQSERKLSFTLLYGSVRIAGIDFGRGLSHRNIDGTRIVGAHMQLWVAVAQRAEAIPLPPEMPEWNEPVQVWVRFCAELGILHLDDLISPAIEEASR